MGLVGMDEQLRLTDRTSWACHCARQGVVWSLHRGGGVFSVRGIVCV